METGEIFTSRDVIFHEGIYPYETQAKAAEAFLQPRQPSVSLGTNFAAFEASGPATAPNPGCLREAESSGSHLGPQDGPNSSLQPTIEGEGAVRQREDQASPEEAAPTLSRPRSDAAPRPSTSRDRGSGPVIDCPVVMSPERGGMPATAQDHGPLSP